MPNAIYVLNPYLSIAVHSFRHRMHSRQNTVNYRVEYASQQLFLDSGFLLSEPGKFFNLWVYFLRANVLSSSRRFLLQLWLATKPRNLLISTLPHYKVHSTEGSVVIKKP